MARTSEGMALAGTQPGHLLGRCLGFALMMGLSLAAEMQGPPYLWPKYIHHTVINRSNVACEQLEIMRSWTDLNPGYRQIVWEHEDMDKWMSLCFPRLVPLYNGFLHAVERADFFRYLVLYKMGGVYSDVDVQCLQPIPTWNEENNHDAALYLGANAGGFKGDAFEIQNWVMATMAGHEGMSEVIQAIREGILAEYFREHKQEEMREYRHQIIDRTGPGVLKRTILEMLQLANDTSMQTTIKNLWASSAVRVTDEAKLSEGTWGWDPVEYCNEIKANQPEEQGSRALACHHYHGSWKAGRYARGLTYGCEQLPRASGPLSSDYCTQPHVSSIHDDLGGGVNDHAGLFLHSEL